METLRLRLESYRARKRVDAVLGRTTAWDCVCWVGSRGPKAGCAPVSQDEWARVQESIALRGWAGMRLCTTCPAHQPQQQRLL